MLRCFASSRRAGSACVRLGRSPSSRSFRPLTIVFFSIDNLLMSIADRLHVGIAALSPLRVAHLLCLFPTPTRVERSRIRKTFQLLREWVVGFGLDPDTLLHIGIPSLDDKGLTTYDCCIEFPLPIDEESGGITQTTLPGGRYAVLRLRKIPALISKAIREFQGDYLPDHGIALDPDRPTYEIYYVDTMEYCVPILV